MDEGRFGLGNIGPKQSVFELKFNCADDFAIAFGDIKEIVGDIIADSSG